MDRVSKKASRTNKKREALCDGRGDNRLFAIWMPEWRYCRHHACLICLYALAVFACAGVNFNTVALADE